MKALGFKPYDGSIIIEGGRYDGEMLLGAFCNSRLAGGGQQLAPNAMIDDGLMDLTLVRPFLPHELPKVIEEINNPSEKGEFVKHTRASWLRSIFRILYHLTWMANRIIPVKFDLKCNQRV